MTKNRFNEERRGYLEVTIFEVTTAVILISDARNDTVFRHVRVIFFSELCCPHFQSRIATIEA